MFAFNTRWAGTLVIVAGALLTTDLGSYVSTAVERAHSHLRQNVPIAFEIDRAEQQIAAMDTELVAFRKQLAEIGVAAEESAAEAAELDASIQALERELAARLELLAPEGREEPALSPAQRQRLAADLQRTNEQLKAKRATHAAKAAIHAQQSEAARLASERLRVTHVQREQLLAEIEKLRAQNLAVETQATLQGSLALDITPLGDARRTLVEVRRRVKVAERMLAESAPVPSDPLETDIRAELVLAEARELLAGATAR